MLEAVAVISTAIVIAVAVLVMTVVLGWCALRVVVLYFHQDLESPSKNQIEKERKKEENRLRLLFFQACKSVAFIKHAVNSKSRTLLVAKSGDRPTEFVEYPD
jgi:hypothetical protein